VRTVAREAVISKNHRFWCPPGCNSLGDLLFDRYQTRYNA